MHDGRFKAGIVGFRGAYPKGSGLNHSTIVTVWVHGTHTSCSNPYAKEHFEKEGYSIGINTIFSRTIIPLELYEDKDILFIMIEVNKSVYAEEKEFNRLQMSIGGLLGEIGWFYVPHKCTFWDTKQKIIISQN